MATIQYYQPFSFSFLQVFMLVNLLMMKDSIFPTFSFSFLHCSKYLHVEEPLKYKKVIPNIQYFQPILFSTNMFFLKLITTPFPVSSVEHLGFH